MHLSALFELSVDPFDGEGRSTWSSFINSKDESQLLEFLSLVEHHLQSDSADQAFRSVSLLLTYLNQVSSPPFALALDPSRYSNIITTLINTLSTTSDPKLPAPIASSLLRFTTLNLHPTSISLKALLSSKPLSTQRVAFRSTFLSYLLNLVNQLNQNDGPFDDVLPSLITTHFSHESDPRCLVPLFKLVSNLDSFLITSSSHVITSLFTTLTSYFPVTYQPPDELKKEGITLEGLKMTLFSAMSIPSQIAQNSFDFLIEVAATGDAIDDCLEVLKFISQYNPEVYNLKICSLKQSRTDNSNLISTLSREKTPLRIEKTFDFIKSIFPFLSEFNDVLCRICFSFTSFLVRNYLEGVGLAIASDKESSGTKVKNCLRKILTELIELTSICQGDPLSKISVDDVILNILEAGLNIINGTISFQSTGTHLSELPFTIKSDCSFLTCLLLKRVYELHDVTSLPKSRSIITNHSVDILDLIENLLHSHVEGLKTGKVSRTGKVSAITLIGLVFYFQSDNQKIEEKLNTFVNKLLSLTLSKDESIKNCSILTLCLIGKSSVFQQLIAELFSKSLDSLINSQFVFNEASFLNLVTLVCFFNVNSQKLNQISCFFDHIIKDHFNNAIFELFHLFIDVMDSEQKLSILSPFISILNRLLTLNHYDLIESLCGTFLKNFNDNFDQLEPLLSFVHTNLSLDSSNTSILSAINHCLKLNSTFIPINFDELFQNCCSCLKDHSDFLSAHVTVCEPLTIKILNICPILNTLFIICQSNIQSTVEFLTSSINQISSTSIIPFSCCILAISNSTTINSEGKTIIRRFFNHLVSLNLVEIPSILGFLASNGGDFIKTIARNSIISKFINTFKSNSNSKLISMGSIVNLFKGSTPTTIDPSELSKLITSFIYESFNSKSNLLEDANIICQSLTLQFIKFVFNFDSSVRAFVVRLIPSLVDKVNQQLMTLVTLEAQTLLKTSSFLKFYFVDFLHFVVCSIEFSAIEEKKRPVTQALLALIDDSNSLIRSKAMETRHLWYVKKTN
ncbi:hypothetical protein P9112_010995 [Eukaryota sp. TZLM1-RC]